MEKSMLNSIREGLNKGVKTQQAIQLLELDAKQPDQLFPRHVILNAMYTIKNDYRNKTNKKTKKIVKNMNRTAEKISKIAVDNYDIIGDSKDNIREVLDTMAMFDNSANDKDETIDDISTQKFQQLDVIKQNKTTEILNLPTPPNTTF